MIEIKAPSRLIEGMATGFEQCIFLAGSIEMGQAEKWQERFAKDLAYEHVIIFNPRRDDWDSTWVQSMENPHFVEQVTWELDYIEDADMVVFFFDPATKSPITLMELGYVLGMNAHSKIFVCCPDGFWRKGNVEIICQRSEIPILNSYQELLGAVGEFLL